MPPPTTLSYPTPYDVKYSLGSNTDITQTLSSLIAITVSNTNAVGCFEYKIFNTDESSEPSLPNGVSFDSTTQVLSIVKTTTEDLGTLAEK